MALEKIKEIDNLGISGDYHKIVETNINWASRGSHVTLATYLNQQARLDGKNPLETTSFDWSGDEFPFDLPTLDAEGMNTIKVAYTKIKESKLDEEGNETNWFADAIDC
jgi:hypothetical protein